MLNSIALAIVLPTYVLLAGLIGIPYTLLSGNARPLFWLARQGVRLGFAIARIRIVAHGRERLSGEPHFIYMMNHNSNLDVPAVFLLIPGELRILGKQELFKLPVLGTAMRLGGFVPVDRSNRERAIESVRNAAELAAAGDSFLLAPEGTRSRSGRLLRFKKGGFHMAIDSKVPIMPITVVGAFELMPPGSFAIRSGRIDVYFHEGISTEDFAPRDRAKLIEKVRGPMLATLATARPPLSEAPRQSSAERAESP